jgi:hypothetical protein
MHRVIAHHLRRASIVQNTALERREIFRVHAVAAIRNAPAPAKLEEFTSYIRKEVIRNGTKGERF